MGRYGLKGAIAASGVALLLLSAFPVEVSAAPPPDKAQKENNGNSGGRNGKGQGPAWKAEELLVRFDPSTPESEKSRVRKRQGLQKLEDLTLLPGLERVRTKRRGNPPEHAARVARERTVRYAEPNYTWTADVVSQDDPATGLLWGFENDGSFNGGSTPDADADVPEGWARGADTSTIKVGVIDEGVDINHADLAANIWTNPDEIAGNGIDDDGNGYVDDVHGWDFFNDDASVYDAADGDDHGTHVAGTIAAVGGNGLGVIGVSQAQIVPLKFLGPTNGSTSDAIAAIDYAIAEELDILSNSWGGGSRSEALAEAIQRAGDAGMLFVAAAGNGGSDGIGDDNDLSGTHHYPSDYPHDHVIGVANTTADDVLSTSSNFGAASIDVGAPGHFILSTVPATHGKAVFSSYGAGSVVFHSFALEGVVDADDRSATIDAALDWAGTPTSSSVLLVDDDRGWSGQVQVAAALGAMGHSVTTVSTGTGCVDGPSLSTLQAYDTVVWTTGPVASCSLRANDQAVLESYVSAGGQLVLFGQEIARDIAGSAFLSDVMHSSLLAPRDYDFRLTGVAGGPANGLDLLLLSTGAGVDQRFSNAISATPGGQVTIVGTGPSAFYSGTSMATPFVTGMAIQTMAAFPDMSMADVKARLLDTGDPVAALSGKTVSGKRVNLDHALSTGTLVGTVTDASNSAVGGTCVTAFAASNGGFRRSATTDGAGVFSLEVPTGSYKVQFRDCAGGIHATEWHADGSDFPTADAVTVVVDAVTDLGTTVLASGGMMTGTVVDAGSAPLAGICVSAFTLGDTWMGTVRTSSTGAWSLGGFGSGDYQVRFNDCTRTSSSQYETEWHGGVSTPATQTLVTVSSGSTTSGVDATLSPSGAIAGNVDVQISGSFYLPLVDVCASVYTPDGYYIGRARTDASGNYAVWGVGTGAYRVRFNDCAGRDYSTEWYDNAGDLASSTPIATTAAVVTTGVDATLD